MLPITSPHNRHVKLFRSLAAAKGRREHGLFARTVQLKLRYKDFTTITRARTLDRATDLDTDLLAETRELDRKSVV